MKKQIEQVQQYFKEKLLAGEFETKEIREHQMEVTVDGYPFSIWIGNWNLPDTREPYESSMTKFMQLPEFSDSECRRLHGIVAPIVNEYRSTKGRQAKLKQLEELKKELGEI
jgi:hypothetical protein